jgi:hypothetical protein
MCYGHLQPKSYRRNKPQTRVLALDKFRNSIARNKIFKKNIRTNGLGAKLQAAIDLQTRQTDQRQHPLAQIDLAAVGQCIEAP